MPPIATRVIDSGQLRRPRDAGAPHWVFLHTTALAAVPGYALSPSPKLASVSERNHKIMVDLEHDHVLFQAAYS